MVSLLLTYLSVHRRKEQRGTAFLEFMIALPFLLALILGIFDITVALNEYFFLADAVKAGAQRAMTAPNLASKSSCLPSIT